MKNKNYFLSVIVPTFNESKRINTISTIIDYLHAQKFTSEVIIVDDGSTDDTLLKLNKYKLKYDLKIISSLENKGKGHAIKLGMLHSNGKYRLFTDADLSTPITEFDKFLPELKKYNVIIATRKDKQSTLLIHQPRMRELLGKGFTHLSKLILQVNVTDFTCGFKCFSKEASEKIFSKMTINRWGFDSEILFLAKIDHYTLKEIPVVWKNDVNTKVKFPEDIFRSLHDLIKIRVNYILGYYSD